MADKKDLQRQLQETRGFPAINEDPMCLATHLGPFGNARRTAGDNAPGAASLPVVWAAAGYRGDLRPAAAAAVGAGPHPRRGQPLPHRPRSVRPPSRGTRGPNGPSPSPDGPGRPDSRRCLSRQHNLGGRGAEGNMFWNHVREKLDSPDQCLAACIQNSIACCSQSRGWVALELAVG